MPLACGQAIAVPVGTAPVEVAPVGAPPDGAAPDGAASDDGMVVGDVGFAVDPPVPGIGAGEVVVVSPPVGLGVGAPSVTVTVLVDSVIVVFTVAYSSTKALSVRVYSADQYPRQRTPATPTYDCGHGRGLYDGRSRIIVAITSAGKGRGDGRARSAAGSSACRCKSSERILNPSLTSMWFGGDGLLGLSFRWRPAGGVGDSDCGERRDVVYIGGGATDLR